VINITDKTITLIEDLRNSRNLSILYTSHNMDEITRICDEVIFLDHGSIVAQDTPLNLTKRIKGAELRLVFDGKNDIVEKYLNSEKQSFTFPNNHTVIIDTQESLIPKLIFGINETKVEVTDIEVEKPNLEDVFLQIARKEKDVK
jgi:ABC-2 type transport system ATP-binding protein